ncbi:MAG TPA: hypothetical protein VFO05_09140, partial [Candidatus Limnocylindrales bacterium]|nr:hypothetical protein [Candidatus Limnocylindrales bacterium]
MDETERTVLDEVSLDTPWALIETFAGTPRWRPEDVNRGADIIVERLRALGVPVEVHEPEVYLSIPLDASVSVPDGETFRAKPPSMSAIAPEGVEGELVYLPANPKNLRSYSRNVRELFVGAEGPADFRRRLEGRVLITEGFGNPALTSLAESWGAIGLIAVNP